MMSLEFIVAFKEVVRDELIKKNRIDIEGLGLFEVVHHKQYHKLLDTGKVLLMPPANLLQFKSNILMKIDKDQLIELLVIKTGSGKKDIEDQLSLFIKRIMDAKKKDKTFEIKDFGIFHFDDSGELNFDASDELSAEINFKYAGMKPVEIQPGSDPSVKYSDLDSEFILAFREVLREELTKKNNLFIQGLGQFEVIHREQYYKKLDDGKVLLMPPADLIQFRSNIPLQLHIHKEELTKLLISKTGMEKTKVEDLHKQLIERILYAVNNRKAMEIKGFGLFYFDEHDQLNFDPSDELSTEINFKYAGMKPVEIQSGPGSAAKSDTIDDDVVFEFPSQTGVEPKDELEDFFTDKNTFTKSIEFELDNGYTEDTENGKDYFNFQSVKDHEHSTARRSIMEEDNGAKARFYRKYAHKRKSNEQALWILIAILFVAVFAAIIYIWLLTSSITNQQPTVITPQAQPGTQELTQVPDGLIQPGMEPDQGVPESTVQTQPQAQTQTQPTPQQPVPQPQSETAAEVQTQIPQIIQQPAAPTIPEDQPLYGLTGAFNPQLRNSYSIVLHSFPDESISRNIANRLGLEGYRIQINPRTVSNTTMWRVSVGQFETLNDAQAAANMLPAPYNTQNFVQRIP